MTISDDADSCSIKSPLVSPSRVAECRLEISIRVTASDDLPFASPSVRLSAASAFAVRRSKAVG